MSDVNLVVLSGRVTRQVETRKTGSGAIVADIPFASNRYSNKNGKQQAIFPKVTCWEQQAEWAAEHLKVGDTIIVEGVLADDNYEKDGQMTSGRLRINYAKITRPVKRDSSEEEAGNPELD